MTPSRLWHLARKAASAWIDDYAPSMGAALAYYTMFSIAPLLLIAISVAGVVFGREAASGEVLAQLRGLMGDDGAMAIQNMIESAAQPAKSLTATVVGGVLLLVGATTVFGELQDALDRIWRAPQRVRSSGLWSLLRQRLLSFGMILGIGFLLMTSLLLSAALAALGRWSSARLEGWELVAGVLDFLVSFLLTTLMFALIYKLMPRVRVAWRDVWIGAAVTALLFNLGKLLIGTYIGKSGVTSAFGAAGSLAVLLLWVYYSAQIFLLGAEFTWAYAQEQGSLEEMDSNAAVDDKGRKGSEPALPHAHAHPSSFRKEPLAAHPASSGLAGRASLAMLLGGLAGLLVNRMFSRSRAQRHPTESAMNGRLPEP